TLTLLLGIALSCAAGALLVHTVKTRVRPFRLVLLTTICVYLVALLGTSVLLDATVPWANRILAPVLLCVALLVVEIVSDARGTLRIGALSILVLLAAGQLAAWPSLISQRHSPIGYTAASWREMPMRLIGERLSAYPTVASNRPDVV